MSRPFAVEPFTLAFDVFDQLEPSIPEVMTVPDDLGRPKQPSRKRSSQKTIEKLRPAVIRLTPDAATYTSMSSKRLLRYHHEGRLPLITETRPFRVYVADLDKLMSELRKKR